MEEEQFPSYCDPDYKMPNEISVQAILEDGSKSQFQLQITKLPETHKKSFLGGYKHSKTSKVYHHANTQTELTERKHKNVENLRSRNTQTFEMISRSTQNRREYGTQMKRKDIHLDNSSDEFKEARPYFTSAQLLEKQRAHTLLIQCFWRGYLARSKAWARREDIYQKQLGKLREKENNVRASSERQKNEIERRMNPKSVKDFEILYNELETWRLSEHHKIRVSDADDAERKVMVADLLAKETKLLQTIDNLKQKALIKGKAKRVNIMMNNMSKPKKWEGSNGVQVDVNTPYTTRAKELKDLYDGIQTPLLNIEERLDVLLNVKWTVNEFDCALCRDIVDLIDREADLLNRGRSGGTLAGLRLRLSNLFLQFIETPEFNPESARYLKVPNNFEVEPLIKTLAAPSNWVE